MNANELAEIQAFKTEELTMWERNHTATMLRQQQAEIETLKAAKIRAYNNGVEDGRKPNTHPVSQYKAITNIKIEPTVVSYTHPVKELTDEEILKHAEEFDIWLGKDDIEFIKFILRKAQEK